MRRIPRKASILAMMAAFVLTFAASAHAQFYYNWGWGLGGLRSSYSFGYTPGYSSYYTPSYSAYYTPTYSASYTPSYTTSYTPTYTTSYVPSYTASYAPSSECCEVRTSLSVSSACCSPCDPCCTTCCSPCADCCPKNCPLTSSGDQRDGGTTVQPRPDSAGSGRTPTFIEEEDRGGSDYDNRSGTGDGFQPRDADDSGLTPDPLDQASGTSRAAARDELRFKIPTTRPETPKNSTRRANKQQEPNYPVLNLDEKITSRSLPQRTRLIERRSWQQPAIAKVSRETSTTNQGWVPVPIPTQLVQK